MFISRSCARFQGVELPVDIGPIDVGWIAEILELPVEGLGRTRILARAADDAFADEFVDGVGVGFEFASVLFGRLDGLADFTHLRGNACCRAVDFGAGGSSGMAGRQRVFAEAELFDPDLNLLRRIFELFFFDLEAAMLGIEADDRLVERHFAGKGGPGRIVITIGNGSACDLVQLSALLIELVDLQLDSFATGGNVGDSTAYLLKQSELRAITFIQPFFERLNITVVPFLTGAEDLRQSLPSAHAHKPTGRVIRVVDNSAGTSGKGRATPSRKDAEAARKKQMKTAVSRKEQTKKQKVARDVARGRTRDAMRGDGDDRYLPLREQGSVRRFCRDYIDRRFNMAEFLLPILIVILLFSFVNRPWAQLAVVALWSATILATIVDEIVLLRGLRKELKARFEPGATRGCLPYALLRTTQLRRFRMPKPQVKRGETLKDRY